MENKENKNFKLTPREKNGLISIVVPVRNEQAVVKELYQRIVKVFEVLNLTWELIFVEDSSQDETPNYIAELAKLDARVKALFLTRNFSHHVAVTAGLDHACGDHIIMMDGDLQHRPEEIPVLLGKYFDGYDVVIGKRMTSQPFFKQLGSYSVNFLVNKLSDCPIDLSSGMFRIISKRVNLELHTMREKSRFLAGMIDWLGFPTAVVPIMEFPRKTGKTKYNFINSLNLALNWIFSFSTKPLRITIYIGSIIAILSLAWGLTYIALALFLDRPFPGYPSIFVSILFVGGLIILLMGVLGEYIARIFVEQQNRPLYIVLQKLNLNSDSK